MTGEPTVEVRQITRRFGRRTAIEDVSFDLRPGEVLGLLGPNGAGKTTTMRVLTGSLRPHAGSVHVGGLDMATSPRAGMARIGYMPEAAALYPEMTVAAYLRFFARLRGVARRDRKRAVAQALGQADLHRVAGQRVGTLSRGFRQRVLLAQALLHDPDVLVLDEPTAGLDPRQVVDARRLIGDLAKKRSVLLSSHLLTEVAQLCRRAVVLDAGRIVAVDTIEALTGDSGGQRIDARVTGDVAAMIAALSRLPEVDAVEHAGDRLTVTGPGPDLGERVAATVVASGGGLVELRTGSATLEDAYLRLVSE